MKILNLVFFILPFFTACRTISVHKVTRLPNILHESSGLVVESANRFWSHNDSGGEPILYQFDSKGVLLKMVKIINARNVDWEDMQLDSKGNLYIADFGNNAQNRKDLVIYKIPNFKNKAQDSVMQAEKISFQYKEQTAFPPLGAEKHFDAEAMVVLNDTILIFTKDFYSQPYSGKTWIYKIPNQVGQHKAQLVTVFETDKKGKYKGAITGAALSPNQHQIVLMSYQKLWIFNALQSSEKIFTDKINPVFIFGVSQFAQREAISFLDGCTIYTTSERLKNAIGGNLSKINICKEHQ